MKKLMSMNELCDILQEVAIFIGVILVTYAGSFVSLQIDNSPINSVFDVIQRKINLFIYFLFFLNHLEVKISSGTPVSLKSPVTQREDT